MQWLDAIPWIILLPVAIFLGLAPFTPEPHLAEKLRMLSHGTLHRPLDIVDLFYHGLPILLLGAKTIRTLFFKNKA